MGKLKNNAKGFGVVEALLVIVILVLIGVVGWMVYKNHHKTTTSATTTANTSSQKSATTTPAVNPYAGWQSYSGNNMTFKYPANWAVTAPGSLGVIPSLVDINSPRSQASSIPSYINDTDTTSSGIAWQISILSSVAAPAQCPSGICAVHLVQPLTSKGVSTPKLMGYTSRSTDSQAVSTNYVSDLELISGPAKVGDTTINEGFTAGNKTYWLVITPNYNITDGGVGSNSEVNEPAGISDFAAFQQSADYKDIVNILNSLDIQ